MTLELWNTFATFGTFVVIAATAIAALVQLRHARGSNQISAMTELRDAFETPQFVSANQIVRVGLESKLNDPEFRYQLVNRQARAVDTQDFIAKLLTVGNFYESVGLLIKTGLFDAELALNMWAVNALQGWDGLAQVTALFRQAQGRLVWENFEYLVVLAQDWLAAHPEGAYPSGVRRIALKNEWLEADRQYSASRAPA